MCADVFHLLAGVRVGVRNAVDDLVEVVVFFDDIEGCTIIDVKEVSDVGDPVIHSGDAVRGVDTLVFENSIVNDRSNCLCTDFFSRCPMKTRRSSSNFTRQLSSLSASRIRRA